MKEKQVIGTVALLSELGSVTNWIKEPTSQANTSMFLMDCLKVMKGWTFSFWQLREIGRVFKSDERFDSFSLGIKTDF